MVGYWAVLIGYRAVLVTRMVLLVGYRALLVGYRALLKDLELLPLMEEISPQICGSPDYPVFLDSLVTGTPFTKVE